MPSNIATPPNETPRAGDGSESEDDVKSVYLPEKNKHLRAPPLQEYFVDEKVRYTNTGVTRTYNVLQAELRNGAWQYQLKSSTGVVYDNGRWISQNRLAPG